MTDASTLERRLRDPVVALAGTTGERHIWRAQALNAAAQVIRGTFAQAACVGLAQGHETQGVRRENLEATLPGAGRGADVLVTGAHGDTVQRSPGADANARGVAALMEIARALREVD